MGATRHSSGCRGPANGCIATRGEPRPTTFGQGTRPAVRPRMCVVASCHSGQTPSDSGAKSVWFEPRPGDWMAVAAKGTVSE
eukprot:4490716-Prymnesium_polylepis.2